MKVLLRQDKTIEFISGFDEYGVAQITQNDDLVQTLTVSVEVPLIEGREELFVLFENADNPSDFSKRIQLSKVNGDYYTLIPQEIVDAGGTWNFQVIRRRHSADKSKSVETASNKYPFTVGEGVKNAKGELVTKTELQSVYNATVAIAEAIKEGVVGGTDEERVREIVAEETADLDGKADTLSAEIAVINTILSQSGLVAKYKPIEDTYTERVTADGLNVLDGSKAKLEKVVGSTVACKNLVDIEKIDASMGDSAFTLEVNFTQNIFVSAGELATVSTSIWRFSCTRKDGSIDYVTDENLANSGKKVTATADNPIVRIVYRGTNITAGKYSKIMIAYGDTATAYQPYFTGLKSASFGGIESTNADGTETSTLAFPKTETPLGVTIDFETKKITDYGVDLVLTGEEQCGYYSNDVQGVKSNGISFYDLLPSVENRNQNGVCTDANLGNFGIINSLVLGLNSKAIYWIGVLDILGFTTAGVEPSAEEKTTVVANFKAYLAQRYADGNPVTIRYVSSTLQSETDFTADNEYTAYKGGTEKVLENDGKEYGADNTLSQNYIVVNKISGTTENEDCVKINDVEKIVEEIVNGKIAELGAGFNHNVYITHEETLHIWVTIKSSSSNSLGSISDIAAALVDAGHIDIGSALMCTGAIDEDVPVSAMYSEDATNVMLCIISPATPGSIETVGFTEVDNVVDTIN